MNDTHLMRLILEMLVAMDKNVRGNLPKEVHDCVLSHAFIAASTSIIPIPGASMAANVANIWTMYARINSKVGISLGDNVLKTIASGVAANLGSYVVLLGVGELLKFVPVVGSIAGTAIEAAISYSITLTSAFIYIKAITVLASKKNVQNNAGDLGAEVEKYMKENADEIKEFMKEAKKAYKESKK